MRRTLTALSILATVAATAPRDAAARSAITVHAGSGQPAQIAFFGDDLLVGSPLPGNVQQIDMETGTVVRTFGAGVHHEHAAPRAVGLSSQGAAGARGPVRRARSVSAQDTSRARSGSESRASGFSRR